MLSSIWGNLSRRARVTTAAVALAALAGTAGNANAQEVVPGSAYSLSFGTDVTSHFISYGADVWGGGNELSPFSPNSTAFTYGTLTADFGKVGDNIGVSGFINVWSDLNNNVDSGIGGPIQEIDVNAGVTVSFGDFSITGANGFWIYAGAVEKIADLTVAYNDDGKIIKGIGLNPSVTLHYRYEGIGGQETGLVVVPGIKPTFTFMPDSEYPISLALPVALGIFTEDGFQGGDSGIGFFSAGAAASVPLPFIPKQYGDWTASASITYFHTPSDQVPGNPRDNFFVTSLSIGLAF